MALLEVRDLVIRFRARHGTSFHAVDGVTFAVEEGTTLGLVGESGSGKSTIGRAILGLQSAWHGSVRFDGRDITSARGGRRRRLAREIQAVFQDPYRSLDPLRRIGETLQEPLRAQRIRPDGGVRASLERLLAAVGLRADALGRYPSDFSGGQRQRIAIARALAVQPRLIVADEPISALDLSTQAQVVNLMRDLQAERRLTYLFIAHDLHVVRQVSDTVVVLYRGRVMESGRADDVCADPWHPYARALWAAAPVPDPARQAALRNTAKASIGLTTSQAVAPPATGCPFAPRCAFAADACWSERPKDVSVEGRTIACHLFDESSSHPQAGAGTLASRHSDVAP